MYQFNRGAAALLAGVLSVSSIVPAFAYDLGDTANYDHITTAGNVGNAAVMLTVEDREEPVIFSAYVPAELPIAIDVNGDVTVPQNAKIINGVENLPIAVEDIDVTMENGWTLASMSDDLTSETKDTKKVAMEVLGQDLSDADSFSPAKIEAGSEIALNMQAKLPEQSASSKTKIATIGFTVDWWEDESTIPEVPELNATNLVSASRMRSVLHDLTGSIVFSTEMYDPEQHPGTATDISKERDGSVMAVVNGQDAVVYSEGGTLAPSDSSLLFVDWNAGSPIAFQAESLDLRGLDTSIVTDMSAMFREIQINELDLSLFDTSNVIDMSSMFGDAQIENLNLSSLNTTKVTSMEQMFQGCHMKTLDLSSFDTSNVTSMRQMFLGTNYLETLDLSSFDMSNVNDIDLMFPGCFATTVFCRTEADATILSGTRDCPSTINFVVKQ